MTAAYVHTLASDPYLWLEDVSSPKAMAWVDEHNARSTAILQSDPRYQQYYDEALAIAQAEDRIPVGGSSAAALQFLAGRDPRARHLAAHHAGELSHRAAGLEDGARPRRARRGREGELGLERRGLRCSPPSAGA